MWLWRIGFCVGGLFGLVVSPPVIEKTHHATFFLCRVFAYNSLGPLGGASKFALDPKLQHMTLPKTSIEMDRTFRKTIRPLLGFHLAQGSVA